MMGMILHSVQVFFLWYYQDLFNSCPIDNALEWHDINAYFLLHVQHVHKEMHIHVHSYNIYKEAHWHPER